MKLRIGEIPDYIKPIPDFEPEDSISPEGPPGYVREANPFTGGEIQRQAHADGCHDYDRSECGRKSWINRDRVESVEKLTSGFQVWKEENSEYYSKLQSEKGKMTAKTMTLNGVLYRGWKEVKEKTGLSKFLFKKAGGRVL